jgi:hypothetical protein
MENANRCSVNHAIFFIALFDDERNGNSIGYAHDREVIFGGVGAGMYGMLVFVILSVFIAGLMVGRTPEYLGKKIG